MCCCCRLCLHKRQGCLLVADRQKCQHPGPTWKLPLLLCHSNALQWQLTSPSVLAGCSATVLWATICKWEKTNVKQKKGDRKRSKGPKLTTIRPDFVIFICQSRHEFLQVNILFCAPSSVVSLMDSCWLSAMNMSDVEAKQTMLPETHYLTVCLHINTPVPPWQQR